MIVTILIILALLLIVLLLALFVPLRLSFRGGYDNGLRGAAEVSWLWGLTRAAFSFDEKTLAFSLAGAPVFRKRVSARKAPRKKRPAPPKKKRAKIRPSDIPCLLGLARRIIRSMAPRGRIRAAFGLDDPAATGVLYGMFCALRPCIPFPVAVTPEFSRAFFRFQGYFSVRILGARLAAILLGAFLSPRGRKLLRGK